MDSIASRRLNASTGEDVVVEKVVEVLEELKVLVELKEVKMLEVLVVLRLLVDKNMPGMERTKNDSILAARGFEDQGDSKGIFIGALWLR